MIGLTMLRTFQETMSLRKTAARMPSGTAKSRAPAETYSEPAMRATTPKTGGSAVGYQLLLVKNSARL